MNCDGYCFDRRAATHASFCSRFSVSHAGSSGVSTGIRSTSAASTADEDDEGSAARTLASWVRIVARPRLRVAAERNMCSSV